MFEAIHLMNNFCLKSTIESDGEMLHSDLNSPDIMSFLAMKVE